MTTCAWCDPDPDSGGCPAREYRALCPGAGAGGCHGYPNACTCAECEAREARTLRDLDAAEASFTDEGAQLALDWSNE